MDLKVISFNIRCCDDPNGHSVGERAPRLAAVTAPRDADVIGLQEYTPLWEESIARIFGEKYEFMNHWRASTGHMESAPILWKRDRFDCLRQGWFWLSDTPEVESGGWDTYGHNRICLYAVLRDKESGTAFTFMNTHFGFGTENQIKSARLIASYARKISDLPTFITGDFNMTPDAPAYGETVKHWTDVNAALGEERCNTYHGYDPERAKDSHIDYCFVNEKVTPKAWHCITERVDGKFPSDHFGLSIELSL